MEKTDDQLLALIADGDMKSFEQMYIRYWSALYLNAVRVLRSDEEAKDVVQDVFVSFWERRKSINITTSLKAYLLTSAKYKAINYIEKNITRQDFLAILTEASEVVSPADAELNHSLIAIQMAVKSAMDKMPKKMLMVYKLSREQHLSHKEIAEKLGIARETVKSQMKNALQYIREEITITNVPITTLLMAILFKK